MKKNINTAMRTWRNPACVAVQFIDGVTEDKNFGADLGSW